jgi:hypothetical protein
MQFEPETAQFKSNHVYGLVDQVYASIIHKADFDLEYIAWLSFRDLATHVGTPHKWTILHHTIHEVTFAYLEYMTGHVAEDSTDYFKEILSEAGMKAPAWLKPCSVGRHVYELDEILHKACRALVPSVFHILFSDREFLAQFQIQISELVKQLKKADHPNIMVSDGTFKRPTYLPTWLKAGVFHRDHGRCQSCWRDLTGLIEPVSDLHLDHIIPLHQSGTNDPTNFQLLCAQCNLAKGKTTKLFPARYIPYW